MFLPEIQNWEKIFDEFMLTVPWQLYDKYQNRELNYLKNSYFC